MINFQENLYCFGEGPVTAWVAIVVTASTAHVREGRRKEFSEKKLWVNISETLIPIPVDVLCNTIAIFFPLVKL